MAGHGQTLIDINLTARAGVATSTLALERTLRVYTLPKMLAGVGTWHKRETEESVNIYSLLRETKMRDRQKESTREGAIHNVVHLPIEHSSMSWLQAPPTKPAGQVQMARPFRGLVSHTAPSLQGLLTQASSR